MTATNQDKSARLQLSGRSIAGACLATALPRAARVTLIWLATLASMLFLFIIGMAVIVSLMSCVMIGGIAAWLSIRILR